MTAEKMFNDLGFKKNKSVCYNEQHILYEKPVMGGTDILKVEFKDKWVVYTSGFRSCLKTPAFMIAAIHQQMKELGWIE